MAHGRLSLFKEALVAFVMAVLHAIRVLSDYVAWPLMVAIKGGRTNSLPEVKNKILLMSASDLAEGIRSGEFTSYEVVSTFIRRLREINPMLNAVTDERYRAALSEANSVDRELQKCRSDGDALNRLRLTKPFFGVPITTKNAVAVKDLGNEAGLYLLKGQKAAADAFPIAAMRTSGAIPIAVTNTPEMCLWLESSNTIFGKTSNPYNMKRTCGGSSGGEGAVLSACGSPFGIGTDIAGSVRTPALYNGIFGLKPTINTVDITGHFPMPKDILHPLLIAGPMCKYAKDLRPFLEVLVGPSNAEKMMLDSIPDLTKLKVFYIEDFNSPLITPVTHEMRRCVKAAARHLASLGKSSLEVASLAKLAYSFEIYMSYFAMTKSPPLVEELTLLKGRISPKRELVKFFIGRSKHSLPALFVAFLEMLTESAKYSQIASHLYEMSLALMSEVENLLGDNGVLVCPTLPDIAPYHGMTLLRPSIMAYPGIWNILGFPTIAIPMGLSREGMPLGITVVAGKFKDNVCCEVAMELERRFGGWIAPFETPIDYTKFQRAETTRNANITPNEERHDNEKKSMRV